MIVVAFNDISINDKCSTLFFDLPYFVPLDEMNVCLSVSSSGEAILMEYPAGSDVLED